MRAVAANGYAIGKLHLRTLGAKGAACKFVGRGDAVHVKYTGQKLELSKLHIGCGTHARQNSLVGSRRAVNIHSCFHHGADHCVDLLFGGLLLHGDYHFPFPVSDAGPGTGASAAWPGSLALAFLSDANSSLCRARITSMMRS